MKLKQKLSEKQSKITEYFTQSKNFCFIFCTYKMYLISAKGYENAGVRPLIEKETGIIWASMKNLQDGLGVQNISDLVLKEIYGIYKIKNLTIEQIKNTKCLKEKLMKNK